LFPPLFGDAVTHRASCFLVTNNAATSPTINQSNFKNDLIEHGAVIVVKATTFRGHPWSFESGHPNLEREPGNWYSSEPVSVESEMIGKEMLAWLKPSEQDFIIRYRGHIQGINMKRRHRTK
jgi:hypothetical protein